MKPLMLLVFYLIHLTVFADDFITGNRLEFGIGSALQDTVYSDQELEALLFPLFVAKYKNAYIKGGKAGFIFYGFKKGKTAFWTELIATARIQGIINASGSLEGISDRKNSLDMGLETSMANDNWGMISFSLLHDVLNVHQGYELALKCYPIYEPKFG